MYQFHQRKELQYMARKATPSASKARRLTSEEKAQILRLNAEGQAKKAIAEALQTTPATVGRTIAESQNGSSTTARTRRAVATVPPIDLDLAKRLKVLAVSVVMGEPVDDGEKSALKEIIEQRISEAQIRAALETLARL
jgi:hypothetical protein